MERLDFASVMAVLRRNIPDENFGNQTDFLESLFEDVCSGSQSALEFDNGQVCRWINGMAKLSPVIITHYQDPKNQRALNQRIQTGCCLLCRTVPWPHRSCMTLWCRLPMCHPKRRWN